MKKFTLRVFVPIAVAAKEGRTSYGSTEFQPTELEWLELNAEERMYAISSSNDFSLDTAEVAWPAVCRSIRAAMAAALEVKRLDDERTEKRIQEALAAPDDEWFATDLCSGEVKILSFPKLTYLRRTDEADPRVVIKRAALELQLPARQAAELGAKAERLAKQLAERETREAERLANVNLERTLLREHGTPDQLERFENDVLPTEEFEEVAKRVLFASLDGCPLFVNLDESNLEHVGYCDHDGTRFSAAKYDGPLDSGQWSQFKAVKGAAPEGSTVEIRFHEVFCLNGCGAERASRLGVRVSIKFAGETYRQEYAI